MFRFISRIIKLKSGNSAALASRTRKLRFRWQLLCCRFTSTLLYRTMKSLLISCFSSGHVRHEISSEKTQNSTVWRCCAWRSSRRQQRWSVRSSLSTRTLSLCSLLRWSDFFLFSILMFANYCRRLIKLFRLISSEGRLSSLISSSSSKLLILSFQ